MRTASLQAALVCPHFTSLFVQEYYDSFPLCLTHQLSFDFHLLRPVKWMLSLDRLLLSRYEDFSLACAPLCVHFLNFLAEKFGVWSLCCLLSPLEVEI